MYFIYIRVYLGANTTNSTGDIDQRRLAVLAAAEKRENDSSKYKGSTKVGVRSNNKTGGIFLLLDFDIYNIILFITN